MYESENCILKESVAYKPTRSYQQIVGLSDQCLALGRAFLQDAQRHIDGGIPRLAAYYLYQAVVQFLRAGNMVHYGFLAEGRRSGDDLPENQILYERNCCLVVWRRTIDRMDFIRTLAIF